MITTINQIFLSCKQKEIIAICNILAEKVHALGLQHFESSVFLTRINVDTLITVEG